LFCLTKKTKKNKIKENKKNIVNYLNVADLWDKDTYGDNKFNAELGELKKCNIQINKIIWLYDFLVEDQEEEPKKEDPEKEIKDYIEKYFGKPPEPDFKKEDDTEEDDTEKEEESNDSGDDDKDEPD